MCSWFQACKKAPPRSRRSVQAAQFSPSFKYLDARHVPGGRSVDIKANQTFISEDLYDNNELLRQLHMREADRPVVFAGENSGLDVGNLHLTAAFVELNSEKTLDSNYLQLFISPQLFMTGRFNPQSERCRVRRHSLGTVVAIHSHDQR